MKTFQIRLSAEDQESVIGEGVEFTPLPEAEHGICVVLWRAPRPNMEVFADRAALIGKLEPEHELRETHPIEGESDDQKPARRRSSK